MNSFPYILARGEREIGRCFYGGIGPIRVRVRVREREIRRCFYGGIGQDALYSGTDPKS